MEKQTMNFPTAAQLTEELKRIRYQKDFRKMLRSTISSLLVVAAVAVLISMSVLKLIWNISFNKILRYTVVVVSRKKHIVKSSRNALQKPLRDKAALGIVPSGNPAVIAGETAGKIDRIKLVVIIGCEHIKGIVDLEVKIMPQSCSRKSHGIYDLLAHIASLLFAVIIHPLSRTCSFSSCGSVLQLPP